MSNQKLNPKIEVKVLKNINIRKQIFYRNRKSQDGEIDSFGIA
jgi:hypothetical protein